MPLGEPVAGQEHHARRGDRRNPDEFGLNRPLEPRCFRDLGSVVVPTERRDRPTVVPSWNDDVGFVASLRSMFGRPELTGLRVYREAFTDPVSIGVDLWKVAGSPNKRVVGRNGPIIVQTDDRPQVVPRILCDLE